MSAILKNFPEPLLVEGFNDASVTSADEGTASASAPASSPASAAAVRPARRPTRRSAEPVSQGGRRWVWTVVGCMLIAGAVAVAAVGLYNTPSAQQKLDRVALASVVVPPVTPRDGADATTPPAAPATAASAPALPRLGGAPPSNAEARLMRVYALMAASQGDKALEEAERLTRDVPHFALAQLAYADLLKARTAPLPSFGAASLPAATAPRRDGAPVTEATPAERLQDLSAEARARVGGVTHVPPPGTVPAQFVFLAPEVRFAIAVDALRSRLYLFENSPSGPVLKRDYYASVGKLGISKRIEGDLRTPLGVYFVTSLLPKERLADRYGVSALTLNYPNQYDRLQGRTGSGIWLHGVESATFSRAPLATDGCVAVSNPDLRELTRMVGRQNTPVVISERLDWVQRGAVQTAQAGFLQTFAAWRDARQTLDPQAEAKFFSPTVRTPDAGPPPAATDLTRAARARPANTWPAVKQLSMLAWHDQRDLMLVTYAESNARERRLRLKRQYWMREGDTWNIIFDGPVG